MLQVEDEIIVYFYKWTNLYYSAILKDPSNIYQSDWALLTWTTEDHPEHPSIVAESFAQTAIYIFRRKPFVLIKYNASRYIFSHTKYLFFIQTVHPLISQVLEQHLLCAQAWTALSLQGCQEL